VILKRPFGREKTERKVIGKKREKLGGHRSAGGRRQTYSPKNVGKPHFEEHPGTLRFKISVRMPITWGVDGIGVGVERAQNQSRRKFISEES